MRPSCYSRWRGAYLLIPILLGLLSGPVLAQPYDVLIRGGRVLDGTGTPWRYADLAIRGDRIVAMGDLAKAGASTVIDAAGLYVAPGFIDVHTHATPALTTPELSAAEAFLRQGVTTTMVNMDGRGPVDLVHQRADLLAHGLGLNVVQMVAHGSIRQHVMGMDDRAPTDAELTTMRRLARMGMEAGAFGLSSGPFYAPGSFADTEELVAFAEEVAPFGGLHTSHIRDESTYSVGLLAAVDELIEVSRQTGIPGIVSHVKALGPPVWGYADSVVQRIDAARAEGLEIWADQYPYTASATSLGAALLPRWAQAGGREALQARLDTPGDSLLTAIAANLARRGGADRLQFRRVTHDPSIEGQTLQAVADARGLTSIDLTLDLVRAGGAAVVSFNMDPNDVAMFMRQPWMMTSSDGTLVPLDYGVPHPRNYGSFPRKIRRYVVEEGLLTLPQAIHSMTYLPATVFRIADRGHLRVGAFADLVIFDLDRLRDRAVYTDPHQFAEGVVHLLVNGDFALHNAQMSGLHGRVLHRHPQDARGDSQKK